jgi:uncharacterized protein (DUF849 family)
LLIKGCINGARRPDAHPALPTTPITLGWAAASAVRAGAGAIHFHVRGPDREQSLDADDVARCLVAVRQAIGTVPVGISTLLSINKDPERRLSVVAAWSVQPDFVSVNFNEAGSPALAQQLIAKGVGIEAGLFDAAAADTLVKSGLAGRCLRILLEPRGATVAAAVAVADEMIAVLDRAGITATKVPRLLHGSNASAWGLIDEAAKRGYDTRAGLEDVLTLPDGSIAPDNASILAEAVRRVEHSRRPV